MQSALDQAITAASAAEATVTADQTNLTSIQAAIEAASNGLAPAQAQLATDTTTFNAALDALSAAALAAKIPNPPAGA